ncbi:protein-disulfide isomerase [Pseudomonas syringae]|uniref:protein-disulfide isomerase n=1 Tax=Pseudomonas syringae TaxID=317 RepID=UPI00215A6535|nr:protein-disulfide isomerase [Pseudomonas syringae]MCR8717700.1 protein-disulfide isomerase [Pseudomonas syringae]
MAAIAQAWPDHLEMLPSGLFSGTGARELTPEWADYAWGNDQQIQTMTGQVFSEVYHRDVLLGKDVRFDSGPMNRALTAIQQVDRTLEPSLLHELQVSRYIQGLNTADTGVVAQVASAVAARAGRRLDASEFESRIDDDEELAGQTHNRLKSAQRLMSQLNIRGVPQLLLHADGAFEAIESAILYQSVSALVERLRSRFDDA